MKDDDLMYIQTKLHSNIYPSLLFDDVDNTNTLIYYRPTSTTDKLIFWFCDFTCVNNLKKYLSTMIRRHSLRLRFTTHKLLLLYTKVRT